MHHSKKMYCRALTDQPNPNTGFGECLTVADLGDGIGLFHQNDKGISTLLEFYGKAVAGDQGKPVFRAIEKAVKLNLVEINDLVIKGLVEL